MAAAPSAISELSRGSEWRKWDPHVHSPASALNNQFPKLADGSPDWDKYVDALELVNDVAVLGVTDYFSVDGYRALREFREEGKLKNFSMILPTLNSV